MVWRWLAGILAAALVGAFIEDQEREQSALVKPEKTVKLGFGEPLILLEGQRARRRDGTLITGPLVIEAPSEPDDEIILETGAGHVIRYRWEG